MIRIDESETKLLRSIVSLTPGEIEAEFDDKIASKHLDIEKLGDFKLFLSDKLHTASDKYTISIKKLIALIDRELLRREETEPRIEELCECLTKLSEGKKRIEVEIEDAKERLKRYLRKGNTACGRFIVTYRPGFPYLGVVDKSLLSEEFLSPTPDRKKLLRWFKTNGEVLPGTEIRTQRDTVVVKLKRYG